jgi:hypothetical protein
MNLNEYQAAAVKTLNTEQPTLTANEYMLLFGAVGLADEAGELLESVLLNKSPDQIKLELGDVLWYVSVICKSLEVELEAVAKYVDSFYSTSMQHLKVDSGKKVKASQHGCLWACSILGHVKKALLHGHGLEPPVRIAIVDELHLLAACWAKVVVYYGLEVGEVMAANIAKLQARYDGEFSTEKSVARVDVEPKG